jgi:hypothetical protein
VSRGAWAGEQHDTSNSGTAQQKGRCKEVLEKKDFEKEFQGTDF